ncbi:alpha-amylase family glycosyl hydrolase [Blastococcus brunescens]|uniref:Alpha-amylase family glycosyl hydrolase n=1 Tax=Blastococcus brunescens TaxID=1564165 RepID=A0ABZ1B7V0_9ACTN|nr:alpha-amylase family glycosyl hydrolase [Blastococcus sp. BMG 8361]WRL66879.1 alpha-amylase family glycosyl hydrolase [Blastococcus sp. BMG 8361]
MGRRRTAAGGHGLPGRGRGDPAPACWVLSNHDRPRHVTRYGDGELGLRRARAAALLQLALPGAAYLYNGDELGMPDADLPDHVLQDPIWERSGRTERGRDACRIPVPWSGAEPRTGSPRGRTPGCRCRAAGNGSPRKPRRRIRRRCSRCTELRWSCAGRRGCSATRAWRGPRPPRVVSRSGAAAGCSAWSISPAPRCPCRRDGCCCPARSAATAPCRSTPRSG